MKVGDPAVAQWVQDPVLLKLQGRSQLWLGFTKKKKKKKKRSLAPEIENICKTHI